MRKNDTFTDDDIRSFYELGKVLLKIHNRLASEGKVKVGKDGEVIFLENDEKKATKSS